MGSSDDYSSSELNMRVSLMPEPNTVANTADSPPFVHENDPVQHIIDDLSRSTDSSSMDKQKTCIQCGMQIDAAQYAAHVIGCDPPKEAIRAQSETKQCPLCDEVVHNSPEHCITCGSKAENTSDEASVAAPTFQVDLPASVASSLESTLECILCFKQIANADYEAHVQKCLPKSPDNITSQATGKLGKNSCLNCSSFVNPADGSGYVIPCRSRHIYCFPCLRTSMNEFLASRSIPVCHSIFCDYQLSRHDLSCIPLEHSIFRRLRALIKTQRRPQCPRCHFYVDFDNIFDLDEHIESCHPEYMVPCEYCNCLEVMSQLEEHAQHCRNDPTQRQPRLIDFILPRMKYPFSVKQIDFFIESRKKNHLPLDVFSIVDALAEFEDIFPLELPTRECDVCMETCLYDDIYVFGCDDSHKLCYKCFEQSCTMKMNNNEILTCAICSYQLPYGELKQLRVSPEQRDLFVEYQVQKTFDRYTGRTQGIIKCPNRDCTWAVETNDPNERFHVVCQLCANEFCSLCNQQYHYRTHCQQLAEITQRWFFWCDTERGRYLAERARGDATYAAQLVEYERQEAENQKRNNGLRRRYEETMADEKYKSEHCRLCPHCSRVVEHMGGCASMVCGQDYHGGNDQSGCGQNFTWDQARPYKAAVVQTPKQVMNDLPDPDSQLVVHENITCDGCHETVRGIRFDCVHCPSLIYCEKCEQRCTLTHWNENRQEGKQQHVFRIIMTPFDEMI